MDRKFLNEITEGYIFNHNVFSDFKPNQIDLIRKTIYEDLCEVCDELRIEDQDTYDKLYFSNRLYQNGVFENYLNIRYSKTPDVLEEGVSTEAAKEVAKEAAKEGGILSWIGGLLGKLVMYIYSLPAAAQIILAVITIAAFIKYNGIIGKRLFQAISGIGFVLEKFSNIIQKAGKNYQLRYAIIQKNFDHCYRRAGIGDLNKIPITNYFNKYSGSGTFKGPFDQQKANTLINCYMETIIETIKLQLVMYLKCVKATKGFDDISKLDSHEFIQFIRSANFKKYSFNVNTACYEYFEIASEHINKFDDLLNYFFENESEKRQYSMKLMTKLQQARDEVTKIKHDRSKFSHYKN